MKERNILWVFLAFILGFSLPVCTCIGSCFLSVVSLGLLAEGSGPVAAGPAVAVIRLDGTITSDPADSFSSVGITPGLVDNQLTQAADNPDVKAVVLPILRHRIIVNHRAIGDGVSTKDVVERLLGEVAE